MRTVRYLDEAREEFLHEVEYFTAVSPRLGQHFDQAVQKTEALAAEFSDMGLPPVKAVLVLAVPPWKTAVWYLGCWTIPTV